MRFPRKRGSTSNMLRVFIPDNTSTTGAGLTGLTSASTNLVIAYIRELDSAAVSYTGANIETVTTIGTYQAPSTSSKIRFKAMDATNFPGVYEIHFHDSSTAFGTGDTSQNITVNILETSTTALKIGPNMTMVSLIPWDFQDGVRLGLTALPNAAAAASGGLHILGVNAIAVSYTAGVTISNASGDALVISSSGGNGNGLNVSGNGTGDGAKITGGATGRGLHALGGATSGAGFRAEGQGAGASGIHALGFGASGVGMRFEAGTTAAGILILGGSSSGDGIDITTTSGDGIAVTPTAGNALALTANGTSKHGAVITGGTAGTSDGMKLVAGTGGVDLRANQTGNLTGNVTGSIGSVTGAVGSVTGAVGSVTGAVGSVTGNVGGNVNGNVVGSVASVTAAVSADVTKINGNASSASNLQRSTLAIGVGTADTGSTTTAIATSSLTPAAIVVDQFKGRIVTFDDATTTTALRGQATDITGSSTGGVLTVTALTNAPAAGDTFTIT